MEDRMGMTIATNIAALGAQQALARNDNATVTSLARLSSGYRINSAADGALGATVDILHRMRDLAVQGANDGALGTHGKAAVQSELNQLKAQLGSIVSTAQWNGTNLLDGTYSRQFQVGSDVGETIPVVIGIQGGGLDAAGLGVAGVNVTGGVTMSTTVVPAVSAAEGTPSPGRMNLAGDFVTRVTGADRGDGIGLEHLSARGGPLRRVGSSGDHPGRLAGAPVGTY
jgi:flagellin-like hook-associated protein FlgL